MPYSEIDRYTKSETAGTYRKTQWDKNEQHEKSIVNPLFDALIRDGYVIIPNVLSKDELDIVRSAVEPLLSHCGRNSFEGTKTQRLYAVIQKTLACNFLIDHPLILAILDKLFEPGYLLSQLQAINLGPGEKPQPIHHDDGFYLIPRPRPPLGAATVWAIDDFTEINGSTVIIPKSHEWNDRRPNKEDQAKKISAIMPAGSVVLFLGTLWHGGGANTTELSRLALTTQYCRGYCRQQENYSLSVSPDIVAKCSPRVQELLGYSIYGPFMGMANGMHPKRLLRQYL